MVEFDTVLYDVSDHVAHITMNSPDTLNTLTAQMIGEIDDAMKLADRDRDVHVIIFTGAGRAFSAGHDLSGRPREEPPEGGPRPGSVEHRFDFEQEYYLPANLNIRHVGKPTIAGLAGRRVPGGVEAGRPFRGGTPSGPARSVAWSRREIANVASSRLPPDMSTNAI